MSYETVYNIDYRFERRRYGTGASSRFFTWLMWRPAGSPGAGFESYGDPWPKVRLNKAELAESLCRIRFNMAKLGSRIRIAQGSTGTITGLDPVTYVADVIIDHMPDRTFKVPASQFVELNPKEAA